MSNPDYPVELILDLLNELTDLADDAVILQPTAWELARSIREIAHKVSRNLTAISPQPVEIAEA
jgi:hypothetical protein